VIEFGHNFGLTVVAEGVETKEVLDALVALGCDQVQWLFHQQAADLRAAEKLVHYIPL